MGCSVIGCERKHYAKGLCSKHYQRMRLRGTTGPTWHDLSLEDRFWKRVDKTGVCWLWIGGKANGYGVFSAGGHKNTYAHRVAYELTWGRIPDGLTIDHLCRNPACVNPTHLQAVSMGENVLRGTSPWAENARKTDCPQGHPYDEANTYVNYKGSRVCRKCQAAAMRAWYAKNRAKA